MIVTYLRKSRADMDSGENTMETLAKHEQVLDKLAAKNGVSIQHYYREVVSGESLDARPQMQQLLEHLYSGEVTHLYIMEVERLGRGNSKDQGIIFEALKYSGVKIVTPIKTYDPNDEYDEEYLEFALFMSRREYKTITRRMQTAKLDAVRAGNYLGAHAPFGYNIYKPDKNTRTLRPNEHAEHAQLIFKWFVDDRISSAVIARKLTAMGIPTRTGKNEWTRGTINEILRNDAYAGMISWFKRKKKKLYQDGEYKKVIPRANREDMLLVEGKHKEYALISEEMFLTAQTLFQAPPVKDNYTITNPLAGLLKCAKCGRAVSRSSFGGRARARFQHAKAVNCKVASAISDDVIQAVIEGLGKIIAEFEFKMTNEAAILEQKAKEREIEILKEELAAQIQQRANQFELLEKKIYTEAEFLERRAIVTARMEEIEKILANTSIEVKDYTEEIIKFSQVLDSLKNPNIPAKHQNNLLKDLIERIEYTNECGKIALIIICR